MKKGILLALILTSFIIVSCAVDEHPYVASDNRISITDELKNLTREEAYQKTADNLYGGYLTAAGFRNLLDILTEIEKGTLQGNPIGDVTSPYVAAVILQTLYTTMYNLPEGTPNKEGLAALTYPDKLETDYGTIRSAIAGFDSTRYAQLAAQFKTFVDHQDLIGLIVENYADRLLTTSSSASKPSGSDDNVTVDNFQVVVNVASTIAENFNANITGTITDTDTVVALISDSLYNLSDASKKQLTYDQSLKFFKTNYYPTIADNVSLGMFKTVLTDYINNDGKASGPQKGDANDNATTVENPYLTEQTFKGGTNATIYGVIAKRLYGAPLDPMRDSTSQDNNTRDDFLASNNASNLVVDNSLTLYQKLREYGMKMPYSVVTSLPGHKTIADIVSKHLRMNGFSYKDFNVDTANAETTNTFQPVLDKMFTAGTDGVIPVCAMIQEVNNAIDESATGHFYNDGDYNATFLGLTPGDVKDKEVTTNSTTNKCKITLTRVESLDGLTGTIKEYPFDDANGNQASDGSKYRTQANSTGL